MMNNTPDNKPRYYDDDGTEMNPDVVSKPSLCVSCTKDDDPKEEMLCNLNRIDQQGEADFKCGAYEPRNGY
jgi:hypothetical protein